MNCPKCTGLLVPDSIDPHCMNCGWRPQGVAVAQFVLAKQAEEMKRIHLKTHPPKATKPRQVLCVRCPRIPEPGKTMCRKHLDDLRERVKRYRVKHLSTIVTTGVLICTV